MCWLVWCRYVRNHLLSSDYEGCVTLWDVDTGMAVNEYEAHDKRIWSVDSCTADSSLFVTGSDDGWIKVGLCVAPFNLVTVDALPWSRLLTVGEQAAACLV